MKHRRNMAPPNISPTASSSSWSDLLPDLLGLVLARLPLPADRARFRAVCRGWHSAARLHVRQLPWIVFPNGSFGTIGHGGGLYFPAAIPGLPKNATCLGAATVGWLVLDCTDDDMCDKFSDNHVLEPRCDVKNRHNYSLYNPFSGKIVLLSELDSIMGKVALMEEMAKTFEIRKVLMRCPSSSSNSPDDELIAVTTNNCNCNIILIRPGKEGGSFLANYDVFDVAFHGDRLYGITPKEELVAFDLAEDDKGTPIVTKHRRVIKRPLADGEKDQQSWMYDDSNNDDSDDSNDGELEEEAEDHEEEEEEEDEEEESSSQNGEDYSFNGDNLVLSGTDIWFNAVDKQGPYDVFRTTRHLVQSSCGDSDDEKSLLMVRHHTRSFPKTGTRNLGVDVLKADMKAGNWVPVSELAEGEALFLSRSFSTSTRAYGDIQEGFIYYTNAKDVFDTKSGDCRLLRLPRQWEGADDNLLTWLFPPELHL